MIYNVQHADWVCTQMKDLKKDSHVTLRKDDMRDWFYTINVINSLRTGVSIFQGEELADFKVPSAIKELVVPSKVTVSQGTYERDFLSKDYKTETDAVKYMEAYGGNEYNCSLMDADQFSKFSRKLLRAFKLEEESLTDVASLHDEVLLSTIQDRAVLEDRCIKGNASFIPVFLEFWKFEDDEYVMNIDRMFKQYFNDSLFIHKKVSNHSTNKQD